MATSYGYNGHYQTILQKLKKADRILFGILFPLYTLLN